MIKDINVEGKAAEYPQGDIKLNQLTELTYSPSPFQLYSKQVSSKGYLQTY